MKMLILCIPEDGGLDGAVNSSLAFPEYEGQSEISEPYLITLKSSEIYYNLVDITQELYSIY